MRPKLLLNLCAGDIASGWWGKMAGGKESENERQRDGWKRDVRETRGGRIERRRVDIRYLIDSSRELLVRARTEP